MLKTAFSRASISLSLGVVLCAAVGSAQTCPSTINGFYSYTAIGNGIPGALIATNGTGTGIGTGTGTGIGTGTGTGTGTSTGTQMGTLAFPTFTNTGVGQLVGGSTNSIPFSGAGTLYFDGSGNIRASSTPQFATASAVVGSYVLNSDCTISVTLNDGFGTNTTKANLQGVVLGDGAEIDLGVLQNISIPSGTITGTGTGTGTGTSATASTTPGVFQSNILIKLVRPLATFCTTSNLVGPYAIVASGTRVATSGFTGTPVGPGTTTTPGAGTGTGTGTGTGIAAPTETPYFLFGRVQFDGNGSLTAPSATPSPLGFLQFVGTYTVNNDCTGTLTLGLMNSTNTTTTATGSTTSNPALSLNFILTQGRSTSDRPELEFSQSNGTQTLFGYGQAD